MKELILEFATQETAKFDEDGILHNCLICGYHSDNKGGYNYTQESFTGALEANLYEDSGVFLDHPEIKGGEPVHRKANERLGILRNVHLSPEGLRADYHANTSHPMYEIIKEDFEKALGGYSFSHVAKTERDDNRNVKEIYKVYEVDICATPNATTTTLLETKMDDKELGESAALAHNALMMSMESVIKDESMSPDEKKCKICEHLDHHFKVNPDKEEVKEECMAKESKEPEKNKGDLLLEQLQHEVAELKKITEMQHKYFVSPMSAPPSEMIGGEDHLEQIRKQYNS